MFNEVKAPNEESSRHVRNLKILSGLFLLFGLLKFQVIEYVFADIISSLILVCAFYQMNYCMLIFFILNSIFNILIYINFFGVYIVKKSKGLNIPGINYYIVLVMAWTFILYIYANYECFLAYKCFKKISLSGQGLIEVEFNENKNNSHNTQSNVAFQGKGIRL